MADGLARTRLADEQMEKQAGEFRAERDRMLEERERLAGAAEKAADEAELSWPLGLIWEHGGRETREYALPSDASENQKAAWEKMTAKESFRTAGRAAINGGVWTCEAG